MLIGAIWSLKGNCGCDGWGNVGWGPKWGLPSTQKSFAESIIKKGENGNTVEMMGPGGWPFSIFGGGPFGQQWQWLVDLVCNLGPTHHFSQNRPWI